MKWKFTLVPSDDLADEIFWGAFWLVLTALGSLLVISAIRLVRLAFGSP